MKDDRCQYHCESLHKHLITKLLLVIWSERNLRFPSKSSSESNIKQKLNKWFNLEIKESDVFKKWLSETFINPHTPFSYHFGMHKEKLLFSMKLIISMDYTLPKPNSIDLIEPDVSIPVLYGDINIDDYFKPECTKSKTFYEGNEAWLIALNPNKESETFSIYPSIEMKSETSATKPTGFSVIFEEWDLQFDLRNFEDHLKPLELATLYKKAMLLFRFIFSFTKLMPLSKFKNNYLNARNDLKKDTPININIQLIPSNSTRLDIEDQMVPLHSRLLSGLDPVDFVNEYNFPLLSTMHGMFGVKVKYRELLNDYIFAPYGWTAKHHAVNERNALDISNNPYCFKGASINGSPIVFLKSWSEVEENYFGPKSFIQRTVSMTSLPKTSSMNPENRRIVDDESKSPGSTNQMNALNKPCSESTILKEHHKSALPSCPSSGSSMSSYHLYVASSGDPLGHTHPLVVLNNKKRLPANLTFPISNGSLSSSIAQAPSLSASFSSSILNMSSSSYPICSVAIHEETEDDLLALMADPPSDPTLVPSVPKKLVYYPVDKSIENNLEIADVSCQLKDLFHEMPPFASKMFLGKDPVDPMPTPNIENHLVFKNSLIHYQSTEQVWKDKRYDDTMNPYEPEVSSEDPLCRDTRELDVVKPLDSKMPKSTNKSSDEALDVNSSTESSNFGYIFKMTQ